MAELKSFDESKAGVKGLADSGIKEIPRIFHAPPQFLESGTPYSPNDPNFIFPVIDLAGVHQDPVKRKQMVEKIRDASGSWGFFQIVNHRVPKNIQEDMTSGVRKFFDLDLEQKKEYYAREQTKKVMYSSNPDMYAIPVCSWTDLMLTHMSADDPLEPEELPECCRDIVPKYSAEMARVGNLLFQLLSEALGLESNYLKEIDCVEAMGYAYHYYPPCPQPELALGCVHHTDIDFLTVILQDQVGGIKEIPRIFHAPPHFLKDGSPYSSDDPNFKFPIIDLSMVHDPIKRKETVDQIRNAAESWGFFVIVNHGVPKNIQDEMTTRINEFFELDVEQKKEFYGREQTKKVMYSSNPDMYATPVCSWGDMLITHVTPEPPEPEDLPECCKEIVPKYTSEMNKLGDLLFELLSEGLGLESNHLKDMGCPDTVGFVLHYYPPCPQPELAIACVHHTDIDFLTVIVQDQVGGLQVLRHNSWIDVPYIPGALVINIGDMLQVSFYINLYTYT
ncbi:1-aminocyclopropane-1-carboxylate oxidase homolog 1 [Linum perenne]